MTTRKANKLIDKILKEDDVEAGVFISMLSYEYMVKNKVTEAQFLRSLKNSIKILKETEE